MTIRRKCLIAAAVLAAMPAIFSLHGQTSKAPSPRWVAPPSSAPPPGWVAPKGLKVFSTPFLDPVSGGLTVDLKNVTTKTVVAYSLEINSFDSQGRQVAQVHTEADYIAPEPNPYRLDFILPSQVATVSKVSTTAYGADSDLPDIPTLPPDFVSRRNEIQRRIDRDRQIQAQIASVQVSVFGVVYDDRTFEGDAGWIFDSRLRKAALARYDLDHYLKAEFPASREENRKAMESLRTSGFNAPEEALSKAHWESIRAEIQRDAEWWESQSRPQETEK